MEDDVRLVTHPQAASNWYVTLADLMVLLATFFIMLISMSSISDVRTRAAIHSVNTSFNDRDTGGRGHSEPFVAADGDLLGAQEFQNRVGVVLQTAIPAVRVSTVQPGKLLQAEFDGDALFLADVAQLRPAQRALLDRLVAAVAVPPPGRRIEMEFLAAFVPDADGMMPVSETLPVARAGAFAREITARGLPATALTVGVERGAPGKLRLLFRLVQAESGERK